MCVSGMRNRSSELLLLTPLKSALTLAIPHSPVAVGGGAIVGAEKES